MSEKLRAEKSSLHPNTKKVTTLILNFEWNIMHRQLFHTLGADMAIAP